MSEHTTAEEREFPILAHRSYVGPPHPTRIPWSVADLAYAGYSAEYGTAQSLERIGERGGFGAAEMDRYVPDWRSRCGEVAGLRAERDARERAMAATVGVIDTYLEERERTGAIHDRAFHLGQKLEKVAAERDALAKRVEELESRLPCGHRKIDWDDSYGGCAFCAIKCVYEECEVYHPLGCGERWETLSQQLAESQARVRELEDHLRWRKSSPCPPPKGTRVMAGIQGVHFGEILPAGVWDTDTNWWYPYWRPLGPLPETEP